MDQASHSVGVGGGIQLHQGHSIFRNQPSYRIFNKSFEQVDDPLFTLLNEVEPELLKQEQQAPAEIFKAYSCPPEDPRTQAPVAASICDQTIQQPIDAFPNAQNKFSTLGKSQQAACLRVLLNWQHHDDLEIWRRTDRKRSDEQKLVQEHIFEYATAHRELLYLPMKPLVALYKKIYAQEAAELMQRLPNHNYVTHAGLPQLPQCKGLNGQTASIAELKLVQRKGQVLYYPDNVAVSPQLLSNLRVRLDRYATITTTAAASLLEEEEAAMEEHIFVLPLESLLMLLTPGSYIDLPTEMLLKVVQNGDFKRIEFQKPLPARHCGWHTNCELVNRAYRSYAAQPAQAQWLQFVDNEKVELMEDKVAKEVTVGDSKLEYKLLPIDELPTAAPTLKANNKLIRWRLNCDDEADDSSSSFLLFTCLQLSGVQDLSGHQSLGCHLIKLENKPECGCEIMSKYELLSAWLQLKFNQSDFGHCTRISLREFAPILEQQLTLSDLEQQLLEHYHINMPHLLRNLYEFLHLLLAITDGDYLLRYTEKYKEKFLLCKPSLEATTHDLKLHDLLTATPSDYSFATQSHNYLPIAPNLCSRMHEEQQLLPCAFPAKEKGVKRKYKSPIKPQSPLKQTKTRQTKIAKQKLSSPRKKLKAAQKSRNRVRKRDEKKKEAEEDIQLEKFMCL